MRNLFRLKIQSKSTLRGNIKANTFFGVFCQAYKMVHDEDELRIFLECLADNSEEMTFSNMLKPGTLELLDTPKSTPRPHCMVSRVMNGNNDLYITEDKIVRQFDVMLYTSLSKKGVQKLADIVELLGIGANRSVGTGNIKILGIEEETLPEHTNQMTILSDIVPDEETPVHGQFEFMTRHGVTMGGNKQSSIIQIKAGSIFANNKVDKVTYGRVLYDEPSDTFINCKGIAV